MTNTDTEKQTIAISLNTPLTHIYNCEKAASIKRVGTIPAKDSDSLAATSPNFKIKSPSFFLINQSFTVDLVNRGNSYVASIVPLDKARANYRNLKDHETIDNSGFCPGAHCDIKQCEHLELSRMRLPATQDARLNKKVLRNNIGRNMDIRAENRQIGLAGGFNENNQRDSCPNFLLSRYKPSWPFLVKASHPELSGHKTEKGRGENPECPGAAADSFLSSLLAVAPPYSFNGVAM